MTVDGASILSRHAGWAGRSAGHGWWVPSGRWLASVRAPFGWSLAAGCVAVLAFVARLLPVLRGGGLYGLGDYDDAVHYAAAVGLVHGRLPYADFLFLHPPGIILALAPFALVGRIFGDPTGFAAARLGWMMLGAANAALVMRIVRRHGRVAALLAGTFYAIFPPAVYGEHSTQLEGLATTCMLVALLLLTTERRTPGWLLAVAGAALGVSTGIKIWGVAAVLIALVVVSLGGGRRRGVMLLAGAVAGATAVCLPFCVVAPVRMFRMVVSDQVGRTPVKASPIVRLNQIAGLPGHPHTVTLLLVGVCAAFIVMAALAARTAPGRLAVALLVGLTALLMVTPSWFLHYSALTAGPAAVTVGFGAAQLIGRAHRRDPRLGVVAATAIGLLVAGYVIPASSTQFGEPFPGNRLAAGVRDSPGCVTTDNPTTLIEMDVLGRNLDRGCPLVVDLGGNSYDNPGETPVARAGNQGWQRYALAYLKTGTVVVIARFSAGNGFSLSTAAIVDHWQVIQRVGHYSLRRVDGSA